VSPDRTVAFGRQLARAHQELRDRIARLRAGVDDPTSLSAHCLAFCSALTSHHEGEDGGMFVELLKVRPDLAGTVAKLVEDHEMIGTILTRVADLASSPASAALAGELDGLAAIMESHFRFEERTVGAALDDGVPDTGWTDAVFRV
jgi:hypothetical protein